MAANSLPAGAFITTVDGKRCTAVPRAKTSSAAQETVEAFTSIAAAAAAPPAAATATPAANAADTAAAANNAANAAQTSAAVAIAVGSADANTAPPETVSSTSAASTTSSSLALAVTTISTTSSFVPDAAQATQDEEPAQVPVPPVLAAAPSRPVALDPAASSTLPALSVITSSQQTVSTSVVIPTSQTDSSITATTADTQTSSPVTALPEASDLPVFTDSAAGTPPFTVIGAPQASTGNAAPEATDTRSSSNQAVSAAPNPNSNAVQSTVAVAGGVIGGVVAISLLAFIIWWWRRKMTRKRRSTLLTPLDVAGSFDRDEKGAYIINRGSIGPTPMGEKFRAALGYNMKKIRTRIAKSGSPSVNMDRGNSQFMDPIGSHSRGNSSSTTKGAEVTTRDRFMDWWTRLTADMNFNWRLRNDKNPDRESGLPATGVSNEKKSKLGSQPDFLTLLSMDDRELDREAQRRRASVSRKNGSAGSADHFLGGLSLNFGSSSDNPFSDANALAHTSAQPAPLVVSQPSNPFSDSNAIRDPPTAAVAKPSTYVIDMRRSRGQSVSSNTTRQPSALYNSRESVGSVGSFTTHRNKFRSDPFDLERPELLAGARAAKNSITSSTAGTAGRGPEPRRPAGARTRTDSFSSKYSSGVSMGDWSDPGPDVGPAATRWDGPEPRGSPTQGWRDRLEREAAAAKAPGGRERRQSAGSQKSVGRAM
ncbi:hypothetical protein B0T24DRAFT_523508 [Lasiosphaeria ovina]|uniref:Uncharacterized protein n=1 Tax=Lasiosphaeria ovina TaxID=92902 RepID=A0AAE0KFY7_9PEZI|nr:hypothetical protein B0T24DRAFT_523508 [Lasiosphaeria ovina]